MLAEKNILIGIGGGIAVYRVAELLRSLKKLGANVRCIMTPSACEFVSPLTFEALSGEKVHTDLFDLTSEREMGHIKLARWADVFVIAPATANLITKLAYGITDNIVTAVFSATRKPVLLAPAMNTAMWKAPANQENIRTLTGRGIHLCGPESGTLACGEEGLGRLAEPENLIEDIYRLTQDKPLAGQRWTVTAGPTHEHWDAVRFLSNPSSGRMGIAIARAAAALGAEVSLIAGPGCPATTDDIQRFDIVSAAEMLEKSLFLANNSDVFVGVAAVSDFRFAEPVDGKLKRGDTKAMQVSLETNPDIVATIAGMKNRPKRVYAFAAEAADHVKNARKKLTAKGVDGIFANDLSSMQNESGKGCWITQNGEAEEFPLLPKWQLAEYLVRLMAETPADNRKPKQGSQS